MVSPEQGIGEGHGFAGCDTQVFMEQRLASSSTWRASGENGAQHERRRLDEDCGVIRNMTINGPDFNPTSTHGKRSYLKFRGSTLQQLCDKLVPIELSCLIAGYTSLLKTSDCFGGFTGSEGQDQGSHGT